MQRVPLLLQYHIEKNITFVTEMGGGQAAATGQVGRYHVRLALSWFVAKVQTGGAR